MQTQLKEAKNKKHIAFVKKCAELEKKVGKLDKDAQKRIFKLLDDSRQRIIAKVASTDWEAHRLGELKGAVEAEIKNFAHEYGIDLHDWQSKGFDLGIRSVDEPLKAAQIQLNLTALSRTSLEILQGYSADLISNLATEAIKRINNDIALTLLGEQTAFDSIKKIGRNLKNPSTFKTIFHRAEAIARTEINRVYSMANNARLKQASAAGADVKKEWVYDHMTKAPRGYHQSMHGQIKDLDEPFVSGRGNKLMYPHDPAALALETINCKCRQRPYLPGWE